MKQTYINKTREEQDKEIREYFKPYANEDCKVCFGVGQRGWLVDLGQYLICECVMRNIELEKRIKEDEERLEKLSREAGLPEGEVFC